MYKFNIQMFADPTITISTASGEPSSYIQYAIADYDSPYVVSQLWLTELAHNSATLIFRITGTSYGTGDDLEQSNFNLIWSEGTELVSKNLAGYDPEEYYKITIEGLLSNTEYEFYLNAAVPPFGSPASFTDTTLVNNRYIGTKKLLKRYVGTKEVLKEYNGNTLVYEASS
jgi:hypothetical protein